MIDRLVVIFDLVFAAIFFIDAVLLHFFVSDPAVQPTLFVLLFSILLLAFTLYFYWKIVTENYKKYHARLAKYLFTINLFLAVFATIIVIPWEDIIETITEAVQTFKREREEKKLKKEKEAIEIERQKRELEEQQRNPKKWRKQTYHK